MGLMPQARSAMVVCVTAACSTDTGLCGDGGDAMCGQESITEPTARPQVPQPRGRSPGSAMYSWGGCSHCGTCLCGGVGKEDESATTVE